MQQRLSSPSSALLLRDLYDQQFHGVNPNTTDHAERVFGCSLYRNSESIEPFNRLNNLAEEFVLLQIGKLFNMSFLEYLNTTTVEKDAINTVATNELKRLNAKMAQQQQMFDNLEKVR